MRKALLDWLDDRTGYRAMVHSMLFENIPGGSRWRYVWGSTLLFAFAVQLITGFFLWASYSPSSQTAWESVYYIQFQMGGGALLRGIHHFMAQAMIVLLALHMLQIIIDGAYRAPREVNFWIGLILLNIVLGLSLTGYLLPWDQKGYWATKVATNIMLTVPGLGPSIQRTVVGGAEYGHHTLTRFFALHAGLLPALMMFFIVAHVYVFRRHGIKFKEPKRAPDTHFWVDQLLKDSIASLAVLAVVLFLIYRPLIFGQHHVGAELGAPADPSEPYSAARPEWYFLFLYQGLNLSKAHCASCHRYDGHDGTGFIPDPVKQPQTASDLKSFGSRQWLNGILDPKRVDSANFLGAAKLKTGKMVKFVKKDVPDFDKNDLNKVIAALSAQAQLPYQRSQDQTDAAAIKQGREILLKADPIRCLDCHGFNGKESDEANTPNLTGYASRQWLIDFISNPGHEKFYGKKNEMPAFGAKKILDEKSIAMLADWLRGDWYQPGQIPTPLPPAPQPTTTTLLRQ